MLSSIRVNATQPAAPSNVSFAHPVQTRLAAQVSIISQGQRHLAFPDTGARAGASCAPAAKDNIDFPAYCGGFVVTPWDVIDDQDSFDKTCASIVEYLKNRPLPEEEVLYALETGFFQSPIGKLLADLFVEAMMRSIQPRKELSTQQLRDIVQTICKVPPGEWANVFGERLVFPRGTDRNSVIGFIQSQLELSRFQRDEKIANDELLADPQFKRLQEVVKDCRSSIRPWLDNRLNSTLMKLEDCAFVRRSPEETKFLLGEFLQRLDEPRRERFPDRNKRAVYELWQSIELKPAPSLLDELKEWTDPALLRAGAQRVVNRANSALNTLGAMTTKDLGEALFKGSSSVISHVAGAVSMSAFVFRATPKPPERIPMDAPNDAVETETEGDFSLMETLAEIERKSEFYNHIATKGSPVPRGMFARVLYVANILDTVGVLKIAERIHPHLPRPNLAQTPQLPAEPVKVASPEVKLFEQLETLLLKIDELFAQSIQGLTGWNPVAAVETDALLEQVKVTKEKLLHANVKTPFTGVPSSRYGTTDSVYGDTVEKLEPGTLEKLRAELTQWLQTAATYLAGGGVATLKATATFARQHPNTAATVGLAAIYGVVNEIHSRWFAESAPEAGRYFAPEDDPALRNYISDDVRSILSEMPELVQAIKARLEASSYADPHRDPHLIPDIKLLLSEPVPSQPDETVAELIGESIFESRNRYAHLQISRMEVDEDGNAEIVVEDIPANSERQVSADDSAQWVLDALSDSEIALRADQNLQSRLLERLEANQNVPLSVPKDSSMNKPLELYQQTLNDPRVLEWFASKGFDLDTLIIHKNSVSGTVTRDGVSTTQTFSPRDSSGWWQVSAHVLAARQVLDPGNFGLPFVDDDQNLVPCPVILDFYKVVPPANDEEAGALATRLKKEGWPEITSEEKAQISKECDEVTALIAEARSRKQLIRELKVVSENLADDAPLSLLGRFTRNSNYLSLSDKCTDIVEDLNAFLKLPKMMEICKDANIDCDYSPVRICNNKIEVMVSTQWKDLTSPVNAQSTLTGPFEDLLQKVKQTGNTLYSTLSIDLQQVINYMGFGSPKTAGEVRNVIQWMNTTLPTAPPLGDYGADLLGDDQSLIKLTPGDRTTIISQQKGFSSGGRSIIDALGADLLPDTSVEYKRSHVDELLSKMFEKNQAGTWGQQLLKALNWYAADQTALPEHQHKLLLAAIKLAIDPDAPGRPGTVAGYDVYQPKNLGRDFTAIRTEIEQYLVDDKGVSAQAAPLVAHVFLADAAPEFLVQHLGDAGEIGTANWMALRLGVAIAEIQNPGCSRAMSTEQLMALALLVPTTPEQRLLFKSAAVDILMTWGLMNGVVQPRGASSYSSADYTLVANRFAAQRAELSQAIEGFKRPMVTRKELAVSELGKIFSFLTTEPIEEIKIKADIWERLDKFNPIRTVEKSLVEAYMDGDLFTLNWQVTGVPIENKVFQRGVRVLPNLNDLLTASVDSFFSSRKNAFVTSTKSLIAALPLEDRQCLEQGEVKLFTLREETGRPKEDETAQIQAAFRGRQGTLLRCKYQQKVSYFEVFPGRLSIIKRTDLPDDLPLNGVIKTEKAKVSKGPAVNVEVQRGTELPFDFAAYSQGTEPITGAKSPKLIIEPLGRTLPAVAVQGGGQTTPVPDSYGSGRTAAIVDRVINDNYLQGERDFLFKKAKGLTSAEENRAYWEKIGNFLLQLIPFVGCTDDLQSGDRMRFINGAFGCYTDLVSSLNTLTGAVARINTVLSSVVPISIKAFEAIKITGTTAISLVNPLDGLPDLVSGGGRAAGTLRTILTSGVFALTESGVSHLQVCVDRLRGFFGGMMGGAASRLPRSVAATVGRVNGTRATRLMDKWYALDSGGNPIGRALDQAVVDQLILSEETTKA